jgi:hypothetical protein
LAYCKPNTLKGNGCLISSLFRVTKEKLNDINIMVAIV